MPRGAAPNQEGAWRKAFKGRRPSELLELQAAIEDLLEQPAFNQIRSLLIAAHDELVADLVGGPPRDAADYARQTGVCHGLAGLESLIGEIRSAASSAEAKLVAEAESQRRLEVVR